MGSCGLVEGKQVSNLICRGIYEWEWMSVLVRTQRWSVLPERQCYWLVTIPKTSSVIGVRCSFICFTNSRAKSVPLSHCTITSNNHY